jgi:hypothetical protein
VPKPLTPLYTLIWRLILSYYTIAFGFFVFSTWVRHGLKGIGEGEEESPEPVLQTADG